jgi:hypothetical protein
MMSLFGWVALVLIGGALALGVIALFAVGFIHPREEVGPWVVTRVGIGGREFRALVGPMEWVTTVRMAFHWSSQTAAELEARARLADVAPLSKFTGGV